MTQAISAATSGRDLGAHTYTLSGTIMTNFGNHNYSSAYGAGVALQTSTNNVNWSTRMVAVTRTSTDTNPLAFANYSGCNWAAGFPTPVKVAPTPQSACATSPRFANAKDSFTMSVPSGTPTIYFRRLFFVAPRTSSTLCGSVTTASDDVAASDATIVCS